ncbi:type VI secretion system-associated protein TagF [Roseateles violae]|uniref:Type VI secretion system-associated protein TagF n=1 Tax=Roseateles violae TaxID=3058042 RepID=A0ABT8DSH6_9BURK|nr:type VI secretion system-associated protein TagF [Pelomonas sp. PFR6]MDN3920008.1 type VI secretion system-associated protein TagF [Pelomonas sp. PFR6]
MEAPGWYGKLLALGDFASRRLPPHWINACDAWLSGALRVAGARLGERWLEVYLSAPILRFAWAPGIVDGQWWFGVLMCSCDRVGRYYPLLIAQPRPAPPADAAGLEHLDAWFAQLSQAALQTLHDDGSVAALELALEEAPPWPAMPVMGRNAIASDAGLARWLPGVAAGELAARLSGHSLWWRTGGDRAAVLFDIVQGLPDGACFAALLGAQA